MTKLPAVLKIITGTFNHGFPAQGKDVGSFTLEVNGRVIEQADGSTAFVSTDYDGSVETHGSSPEHFSTGLEKYVGENGIDRSF